jgi:hypothetical protein
MQKNLSILYNCSDYVFYKGIDLPTCIHYILWLDLVFWLYQRRVKILIIIEESYFSLHRIETFKVIYYGQITSRNRSVV